MTTYTSLFKAYVICMQHASLGALRMRGRSETVDRTSFVHDLMMQCVSLIYVPHCCPMLLLVHRRYRENVPAS